MALKTLSSPLKQLFSQHGITLSPAQEHVAAEAEATGFDWQNFFQKLGQVAVQILPIVLAIFGSNQAPAAPVQAAAPQGHCCDHHKCCCETLAAILKAADVCSKHMCECCC